MEAQLRLIFLVVGIIILFGVAIDVFRRKTLRNNSFAVDATATPAFIKQEPEIFEDTLEDNLEDNLEVSEPEPTTTEHLENDVIAITIKSRNPNGFSGADLLNSVESAQFQFGEKNIFYKYDYNIEEDKPLLRLVNAVEPGYFNYETLKTSVISGITLLMLPSIVENPLKVFDLLIKSAKQLSFTLNGELLDQNYRPLTLTTIDEYRSRLQ